MLEILVDSIVDCAKLLPFLFLSYLAVEYMEHKMSRRTKMMIYRAGKAGPVLGGILGIIPQCGFAAAAAGLYAGGIITPGTLLAVFLSTSDEMLPIMISVGASAGMISRILAVKVAVAVSAGLLLDLTARRLGWRKRKYETIPSMREKKTASGSGTTVLKKQEKQLRNASRIREREKKLLLERRVSVPHDISHMCEQEHCNCEEEGIWGGALSHTAQVAAFLFVITFAVSFLMDRVGTEAVSQALSGVPVLEEALAGLAGMIPNCAASVLVTQLYLQGVVSSGALFAGLLCGAGAGLLVLYRMNRRLKENVKFTLILYVTGVAAGLLLGRIVPVL